MNVLNKTFGYGWNEYSRFKSRESRIRLYIDKCQYNLFKPGIHGPKPTRARNVREIKNSSEPGPTKLWKSRTHSDWWSVDPWVWTYCCSNLCCGVTVWQYASATYHIKGQKCGNFSLFGTFNLSSISTTRTCITILRPWRKFPPKFMVSHGV